MNRALFVALVAVVVAGLIAGISVVGGPGYARMERRDIDRATRLRALGEFHVCQLTQAADRNDRVSPSRCGERGELENSVDPETGDQFRFEMTTDDAFRICTTFETDIGNRRRYGFEQIVAEGQTGCIEYKRSGETGRWFVP